MGAHITPFFGLRPILLLLSLASSFFACAAHSILPNTSLETKCEQNYYTKGPVSELPIVLRR